MYRVIYILILEHSLFFYLQITINMSEQITTEQEQAGFDRYIEQMSHQAKNALISIGSTWPEIVGSSGSWVTKRTIMKALEQERPWTANKLTNKGNGRNGIIYSLIPMLKDQDLVVVNSEGTHTKYMLTEVGKEVLRAMVYACGQCHTSRMCSCGDGYSRSNGYQTGEQTIQKCSHILRQNCENCEGTGEHGGGRCWRCSETCNDCDEDRNRYCYSCKGTQICQYCSDPAS